MKPVIIIPAYKPDQNLLTLVKNLSHLNQLIVIVNDGSGPAFAWIFAELENYPFVKVLHHAVNLGKGQALKTAFNYFLTLYPKICPGVVTADADGQHCEEDIIKISEKLSASPHELALGVRTFNKKVPWRSRFGNNLTRLLFRLLIGQSLQDTQTGLRGIPSDFLNSLLKSNSSGYEFELDMLISASKKMTISETSIKTIYKEENKGSHFNPVIDSLKIYFVFFRFVVFAMVSGLLDFIAFSFAFMFCDQILLSETLARIISGSCNFLLNKELVFKSKQRMLPEALKYTLLCLVNLIFSYGLISSLVFLGANIYASKMIALIGLFIANFSIQKLLVFGREDEALLKPS